MYCKCKKCGGQMVIEYFGSCGEIHKINKDGTESKRAKKMIYDFDDEGIVYCRDCHEVDLYALEEGSNN